ncbi:PREDICTED: uncharacterized protein LOC109221110 [Nicotiana attenuata]|uniref:uncharacterized protein LOC109221110 n=1 Tax=Nicotiana attenuata TaxID=49451 RepID=UPI0009052E4A|nr:PREDICTED: uncharacterized protein LOC109221110 [Nicotiana attenuata]
MVSILSHCHDGAAGGHYGGNRTTAKVMEFSFFWTTLYKDTRAYVAACENCQRFAALLSKYRLTHKTGTPYHAQTSGKVEVSNCELKRILEKKVDASCKDLVCNVGRSSMGVENCVQNNHRDFTVQTSVWKIMSSACEHRLAQMNALKEFRLDACENAQIFKEKTKRWHDRLIKPKEFHEWDKVLLYNSRLRLFLGKFKSRWTGPYVVKHVSPYGAIEIQNMDGTESFKVNGHRLKPYLAGGFSQQSLSIKIN